MPSGLRAPSSRAAAFSAMVVGSLLPTWGCPEEPTAPDQPALIVSSQGGSALEADGVKTLGFLIRAFNERQEPDNTAVTVTVPSGTLATESGSVDAEGLTAVLSLQNGQAALSYMCPFRTPGAVKLSATNGTVTSEFTVNCTEPRGTFALVPDLAGCLAPPLSASGAGSCPVDVSVELRTASGSFPQAGSTVTATVVNATPTLTGDTGDTNVLAADPEQPLSVSDSLALVSNEEGRIRFYVYSTRLALEQSVEIELSSNAPDGSTLSETVTVSIVEFNNRSRLELTSADGTRIATQQTAELRVVGYDENEVPAADAVVTVTVPGDSGASLSVAGGAAGDEVEVTLGADGVGTVTFTAPETTELLDLLVRARYTPAPELPEVITTLPLEIFPEDALILNAVAQPASIRSDEGQSSTVTVTLTRFSSGSILPVVGTDVTFQVQTSDIERITFGAAGTPRVLEAVVPTEQQTLPSGQVAGVASVPVTAQNDRVRGRTSVQVFVTDGGEQYTTSVEIQVERDPILQSLVFSGSQYTELGVTGSAYPSSTLVTFLILDDLGAPIPNVLVQFDINAAADANASVVSEGLTDAAGTVSTVLSAGTQAGPISIVATAHYDGRTMVAESPPIGIFGGLPSFGNSYLVIEDAERIQPVAFLGTVTAQLADRFSNRPPDGLVVQFRAEGGNVDPVVASADGSASTVFAVGAPGPASASLLSTSADSWSYGALVPTDPSALEVTANFDPASCFDGRSASACDTYSMCHDAEDPADQNHLFCPLRRSAAGDGCWNTLEAGALTGNPLDLSSELVAALPVGTDVAAVLQLLGTTQGAIAYFSDVHPLHAAVKIVVDAYMAHLHDCGPKTGCLTGAYQGLWFLEGDECPVAPGCMDFDVGTFCAQDGLYSVMASTRGEEAFVDLNGNGIFDYDDLDGNNRHDPGEPVTEVPGAVFEELVVDMPEPYLDKNDNGSFDEYSGSVRLTPYNEYRMTDLFGDEDGSGTFGYDAQGTLRFTNRQWDRDKQIFMQTHFLGLLGSGYVRLGQRCSSAEVGGQATCTYGASPAAYCAEAISVAGGGVDGITTGCAARATLPETGKFEMVFQVLEGNGNCASPGFANSVAVASDGPIKVTSAFPEALGKGYCGFADFRDAARPWLETLPYLAADLLSFDVSADCEGADGPTEASIEVTAGDATPATVFFTVDCPAAE